MFVPGGQDDYDEFNINYSEEANKDPTKAKLSSSKKISFVIICIYSQILHHCIFDEYNSPIFLFEFSNYFQDLVLSVSFTSGICNFPYRLCVESKFFLEITEIVIR